MKKKSYLVSGAGSGIGRAMAIALAESSPSHGVILLGRTKSKLEETLSILPRSSDHTILAVDVQNTDALRKAFQEINLGERNLAAIIANAGVGGANTYGENDRWNEIISTNLTGTYQLIQEALPALLRGTSEFKHIVITSSILARIGVPGYSAYCASKAGLLGLMRSMAIEYAHRKILVNAICPGWVDTQMSQEGLEGIAHSSKMSIEAALAEQMKMVPTRKMAQPSEVANLLRYLVSDEQNSITGQCFDINNGALMP